MDHHDELERDPNKRRVKPLSNQELINIYDIFGESSSDSDFCIEDHNVDSEVDSNEASNLSYSDDDNLDNVDEDDEDETERNDNIVADSMDVVTKDQDNSKKVNLKEIAEKIHICSICLGDAVNELIRCDECGLSVHEGCYGVKDDSVNEYSSVSSCFKEPWFCESCKAGVEDPTCELCPNLGGIFKETECGKWVHLVCALYIPGISFGEITSLSKVKLFSNTSLQWGTKSCTLCKDVRFTCTGVTIACDAGMCRSYFHVTCAQQEGSLSEATNPDTDQTDPFYGHCKLHMDKALAKKRKKNWDILQLKAKHMKLLREQQSEKSASWQGNQRSLEKLGSKYFEMKKISKPELTVKSKITRPIATSASACRVLWSKASLMGLNMASSGEIEEQIKTIRDVPKKWNITPKFSSEFVSYFMDRNLRITDMKNQLKQLTDQNKKLCEKQIIVQKKYDEAFKNNQIQKQKHLELRNTVSLYHKVIKFCNPNAKLPDIDTDFNESLKDNSYIMNSSTPNLAALKAGIGFPMRSNNSSVVIDNEMPLGLNNKCSICGQSNDQHLLAKCDVCYLYYHLGCLNPPLTRMPKKTKSFGWQCSACDSSSNSKPKTVDSNATSKLRYASRERFTSVSSRSSYITNGYSKSLQEPNKVTGVSKKKKHQHQKERYSPELIKINKRVKSPKRKYNHYRQNIMEPKPNESPQQGIKLFIKSVPSASGVKTTSQLFFASPVDEMPQASKNPKPENSVTPLRITSTSSDTKLTFKCDTCKTTGTTTTMVQCDDCSEYFHFGCLDPPVKKSPKVYGYSWHCADCDPTESDSSS